MRIVATVTAVAGLTLVAADGDAAHFGSMCEDDYENAWLAPLDDAWALCDGFANELDNTDTEDFYFGLANGKPYFETSNDQTYMETVNLVFTHTHGSTTASRARWAMWDDTTRAHSDSMRLGDEGVGTSILANYACKQLYNGDNALSTRWDSVFEGGLRYATGSHDTVYLGSTTVEVGEDFADEMQASQQMRYAWRDGLSDWWEDQDIAVATMAANPAGCENRRDTLTWQNYGDYTRLRDDDLNNWCTTTWSNY